MSAQPSEIATRDLVKSLSLFSEIRKQILKDFNGILQVDGYAGYNRLVTPDRVSPNIQLAYCWAHARRKLIEITRTGSSPIAEDGVKRIGELYKIETESRGLNPEARLAVRQAQSKPLIIDMQTWLAHHRARVSGVLSR